MKFVFILPSHANTNHIKRVEEFVSKGYDIEVYTFYRDRNRKNKTNIVDFQSIGEFSSNLPYIQRIRIIWKGIKSVLTKTQNEQCIYYLMRNDIALIFTAISSKPYIFEEADMTHLDFGNTIIRKFLEFRICQIIKKSIISVFRSEGFLIFHFGKKLENTYVIPNRLHPSVVEMRKLNKKEIDVDNLKIGFVGAIRFESVLLFAKYILKNYPHHQIHFYGIFVSEADRSMFEELKQYKNCFFHGEFKSPHDLPQIYSQIDLVIATYDNRLINTRYAEPNKLYEAIYFETPIVVSNNTYLASKVEKMNIGYVVNPFDELEVVSFINGLSSGSLRDKINSTKAIPKESLINKNEDFFDMLEKRIRKFITD